MSFFAIDHRQLYTTSKNQPYIGPGRYQTQQIHKNIPKQNYAPFGSLQKKKLKTKSNNPLGPGQYQVRGQICKPSITKYQNNNCIIIKINEEGWSQFKSQTNRFKQKHDFQSLTPGPGQYQPSREKPKTQSKSKPKSLIGQKIKQINLKNYIQRRKPTLFSDPKVIVTEQSPSKTKTKGHNWGLNKKQRFQPLQKQTFHEEHRQQFIDKLKQQKKKTRSKSQSAVFASKSLKSNLQADIYQSSNPFKVQLRKMIDYKDDRPGPGSYNYPEMEAKRKLRFNRHQFFGSTVERFRTTSGIDIGPGYYSPKYQSEKKISPTKKGEIIDDSIQINRHSYIPTNAQIPGPGTYSVDGKRKHKISCKWVFGSKQARFSQQTTIEHNQQQIDEYELAKRIKKQKQYEYRKQYLKNRNQPNFISTSKRFEQKGNSIQKIPPGKYDLTYTDIAERVKRSINKQKQHGRLHKQQAQFHPFMSSVQRFKTEEQQQENTHHDCWCLVKSVQKQMYEHQSSSFTSKQKRTVVFQNNHARYTPAVGSYSKQASLIKSSFNSRFIKTNQSRAKKIKIWNSQRNKFFDKKVPVSVRQDQISQIKVN